jgi:hypothetical protein
MLLTRDELSASVIEILKRHSGRRRIGLGDFIVRDIGIYGYDGVNVVNEIEETFCVDLRPFVTASSKPVKVPIWRSIFTGAKMELYVDARVQDLVNYIYENTQAA